MGRSLLNRLKKERAELDKAQLQAATLLQGLYRGFRDRKNVKGIKLKYSLEKLKLHDLFAWGATMIQKYFRAYVRIGLHHVHTHTHTHSHTHNRIVVR